MRWVNTIRDGYWRYMGKRGRRMVYRWVPGAVVVRIPQ